MASVTDSGLPLGYALKAVRVAVRYLQHLLYLLLPPTAALLGSKAVLAIATWALEGEVDARVAADRVCLWDAVA